VHRLLTFPRPGRGQGDACATVPAETIEGPRKGPHFAHQAALEALGDPVVSGAEPCEFILRLDDDLVLESPDFIERLYRLAASDERIGAVGGVYIQPEFEGRIADAEMIGRRGYSTTVAGMLRGENSAQFYRYDEARTVEAEHLYSSFLYRREAMLEVGGFALCYSARGHREETDATHRLHLAGWKLLMDTGAVARHERCAAGGLRDLASPEELEAMRFSDEALFLERLRGGELGGPRCHSEPKARNLVRDPSLRSG
jgi:GT2 family glycosyltransferase